MHHLTCGISSLLHSVNLIVFTLLLAHLILHISPHHSHHLRSHHLSMPRPYHSRLKTHLFLPPWSSCSLWTDFHGTGHCTTLTAHCIFSFSFSLYFIFCHVLDYADHTLSILAHAKLSYHIIVAV